MIATDETDRDTLTLPAALIWHRDTPLITFRRVAIADLATPFIDDALRHGRVTGFLPLDEFEFDDTDLRIGGAIHHMTRCGSTLMRRQFDAVRGVIALSEPFMFQHLLEGPPAPPATTCRRLRQLAAAWRDAVRPVANRIVIKWPSLLGQHAATLATALPDVPMIFLYRDPVEVLASIANAQLGGARAVRLRHVFGTLGEGACMPTDPLTLWAMVIARTCRAAAGTPDLRTLDYADLPAAGWDLCAGYFGLSLSPTDVAAMRAASRFSAKGPRGAAHVPDRDAKHAGVAPEVRELANRIVAPALADLLARTQPLSSKSQRRL